MSASYQKTVILGNLGADPEMRHTPSGQAVTNLRVAVNKRWIDKSTGESKEITTWYRVSVWGPQAETCNQFLSKGRQVMVEGELTCDPTTGGPRIWTDNDGKARASFELKAFDVQFLGERNGNGNGNGSSATSRTADIEELTEDEIPF